MPDKNRRYKRWTKEEDVYLIKNKQKNIDELAKHLGRTVASITVRLSHLRRQRKLGDTGKSASYKKRYRASIKERQIQSIRLEEGALYTVTPQTGKRDKTPKTIEVIRNYKDHILVKNGFYKECYLKRDILINEYEFKEVV